MRKTRKEEDRQIGLHAANCKSTKKIIICLSLIILSVRNAHHKVP